MDYVFNKYLGTIEELKQYVGKPLCCLSTFSKGSCYIKHVTSIDNVNNKFLEIRGKFTVTVWLHKLKFDETSDERVMMDINFGTTAFSIDTTKEKFTVRTLTETEFELYNRITKELRYLDIFNKLNSRIARIKSSTAYSEGVF